MKKVIIFEIFKKLQSDPNLMRKAKGWALAGIVGLCLVGGITIWASVSAVNYLASTVNQMISSPIMQDKLETAKNEFQKIEFNRIDCWGKAQSLMSAQSWIQKPALDNIRNLKIACLDPRPTICQGDSCEQMKDLMNTAEGRTI